MEELSASAQDIANLAVKLDMSTKGIETVSDAHEAEVRPQKANDDDSDDGSDEQ